MPAEPAPAFYIQGGHLGQLGVSNGSYVVFGAKVWLLAQAQRRGTAPPGVCTSWSAKSRSSRTSRTSTGGRRLGARSKQAQLE